MTPGSLRIAVDVTSTLTGMTGIARYVAQLTDRLTCVPDVQLRRFAIGRGSHAPPAETQRVRLPLRWIERTTSLLAFPRVEAAVRAPFDTVHASGPVLLASRRPVVAVVHDLAAVDHPHLHPPRHVRQVGAYVDRLPTAAAVVAVSESTATRLVAAGVDDARIRVIPNGRIPLPPPDAPPRAPGSFVLAVGAPVPRKRFDVLLHAMATPMLANIDVVIVGPPGAEDDRLRSLARRLGIDGRFCRPGAATDTELAGWYDAAAAVVAPSVEEGFGLPLIEALAAGTPVVASDIPVFREVTGGYATFVPDHDPHLFAEALAEVVTRPRTVVDQIEKAKSHISRYSWENHATATLVVHREVAGR